MERALPSSNRSTTFSLACACSPALIVVRTEFRRNLQKLLSRRLVPPHPERCFPKEFEHLVAHHRMLPTTCTQPLDDRGVGIASTQSFEQLDNKLLLLRY